MISLLLNSDAERADYITLLLSEIVKIIWRVSNCSRKIRVIHNAIEDYWFETPNVNLRNEPALIFLGRIGEDPFTLKLTGFDRLIWLFERFPSVEKIFHCDVAQ